MFVRFVVGAEAENAYWLTGVFVEARILRDDGRLFRHEVEWLEEVLEWFNRNLPCPPFQKMIRDGRWSRDSVSWVPGRRQRADPADLGPGRPPEGA